MSKVSKEVAEQEFQRFIDEMDIDADEAEMSEEDLKAFTVEKNKIIKAICKGSLVINDEGEPVYTPVKGDSGPITFHEPTGAALMAMDRRKKGEDVAKIYSLLAEVTKVDASTFAKLPMRDLRVCTALGTLFLA